MRGEKGAGTKPQRWENWRQPNEVDILKLGKVYGKTSRCRSNSAIKNISNAIKDSNGAFLNSMVVQLSLPHPRLRPLGRLLIVLTCFIQTRTRLPGHMCCPFSISNLFRDSNNKTATASIIVNNNNVERFVHVEITVLASCRYHSGQICSPAPRLQWRGGRRE